LRQTLPDTQAARGMPGPSKFLEQR